MSRQILSFRIQVWHPHTRTCVWTPWSVFQDGSYDALRANVRGRSNRYDGQPQRGHQHAGGTTRRPLGATERDLALPSDERGVTCSGSNLKRLELRPVATSHPSMSALSGGFRPGRPIAQPRPHAVIGAQARRSSGPNQSFRNRAGFIRLRYSDLRHV